MASDVTPAAPPPRLPRYHAVLLAAFLKGATVDAAAEAAGISRRQTLRWKQRYGAELEAARRNLLDAAQAQLREALPATAEVVASGARALGELAPFARERLKEILANREADLSLVARVAQAVLTEGRDQAALAFTIHAKLLEAHEFAARLAAIEERLAALAAGPTSWAPQTFFGTSSRPASQQVNA